MRIHLAKLILLGVLITASGCSMLAGKVADMALGASEKGISVDANAGKGEAEGDQSIAQNAATAVSGQINETSEETFQGPVGQVINEASLEMHELLLLVLLAGWAIPAPKEMLQGFIDTLMTIPNSFRRK